MSTVTSFAELVSQHAEPLPARTVMSLFQVAPSFRSQRYLLRPGDDYTCVGPTVSSTMGVIASPPSCESAIDVSPRLLG